MIGDCCCLSLLTVGCCWLLTSDLHPLVFVGSCPVRRFFFVFFVGLFVVWVLMIVVHCLSTVGCHSLFVVRCWMFVVPCLLDIVSFFLSLFFCSRVVDLVVVHCALYFLCCLCLGFVVFVVVSCLCAEGCYLLCVVVYCLLLFVCLVFFLLLCWIDLLSVRCLFPFLLASRTPLVV